MIVLGLVLVVLMIFAALAIDIGGAYNQRRQAQSAIDTAVLAAAQEIDPTFTTNCASSTPAACAQTNIINFVNQALSTTYTAADFDTCGGITPPASFGKYSGLVWNQYPDTNGCMATERSGLFLWARTPPGPTYKTFIAGTFGVKSFKIGAFAIAGVLPQGPGGVLPFGLTSSTAGLDCLKDSSNGNNTTSCTGQVNGNFGYLQFAQYGSSIVHTPSECSTTGKAGERWPSNTAVGVDHILSTWTSGNDRLEGCTQLLPNETYSETGTTSNLLDSGLLTGTPWTSPNNCDTCIDDVTNGQVSGNRGLPRLARVGDSSSNYYNRQITVKDGTNVKANNTGLWEFIPSVTGQSGTTGIPNLTNTPYSCQRAIMDAKAILGVTAINAQMATCFKDYENPTLNQSLALSGCSTNPCTGQLFNNTTNTSTDPQALDIILNPRFGYVPIIDNPAHTNLVHILGFRAVYLQQLAFAQGNNSGTWDPDNFQVGGDPGFDGSPVRAMSAWVFDPNMLSPCPPSGDPTDCLGTNPTQFSSKATIQLIR